MGVPMCVWLCICVSMYGVYVVCICMFVSLCVFLLPELAFLSLQPVSNHGVWGRGGDHGKARLLQLNVSLLTGIRHPICRIPAPQHNLCSSACALAPFLFFLLLSPPVLSFLQLWPLPIAAAHHEGWSWKAWFDSQLLSACRGTWCRTESTGEAHSSTRIFLTEYRRSAITQPSRHQVKQFTPSTSCVWELVHTPHPRAGTHYDFWGPRALSSSWGLSIKKIMNYTLQLSSDKDECNPGYLHYCVFIVITFFSSFWF